MTSSSSWSSRRGIGVMSTEADKLPCQDRRPEGSVVNSWFVLSFGGVPDWRLGLLPGALIHRTRDRNIREKIYGTASS